MKRRNKRYNLDYLYDFCRDHNIKLTKCYDLEKITSNTIIKAKCITPDCPNDMVEKDFRTLERYKNFGCKDCSIVIKTQRYIETNLEIYGTQHPNQCELIKEKFKKTCIIVFGVDTPCKSEIVKEKMKKTNLKKFGKENVMKCKDVTQKMKNTIKNKNLENPNRIKEISKKREQTVISIYNVKNISQSEVIKNKVKNTCLLKYGVRNPMQNPEISEKATHSAFKFKIYQFKSGRTKFVQGYEPFALNYLQYIENIDDKDIIVKRKEVPEIWYENMQKLHRYYVDIYIPSQNRCIEVKSTWTINLNKDVILLKQNAVINNGYKFELWIFNKKGELIN